jgi:hypothetical protein
MAQHLKNGNGEIDLMSFFITCISIPAFGAAECTNSA